MNGNGLADFVDSVTAVRKIVFEDKRISMADLVAAVRADFEGCEHIRRMLIEDAPKWGNNNDEADINMTKLFDAIIKEIWHLPRQARQSQAARCCTPSRRMCRRAVRRRPCLRDARQAKASCGRLLALAGHGQAPAPTAILQSLGKLPHDCIDGGTLLNIKLTPAVVAGEEGKRACPPS